VNRWLSQ